MNTELWIAILTFLSACVGGARWLIYVYWKQASTIQNLQKQSQAQYALRIEGAIADHKRVLDSHQRELIEVSDRLLKIQAQMVKTSDQTASNAKLLTEYIETSAQRFSKLETQFLAISKDLILVKGSNGKRGT